MLYQRGHLPLADVVDLRKNRGRQAPLSAMLRLMVVGIGCGVRKLRDIEALSRAMTTRMRRWLGLRRGGISDTALYEMLARTPRYGLRQALWQQLRHDLDKKAITNDLFAGGVASFDGKCAGWGKGEQPNRHCQKGFFNYSADASWRLFALRCCLTSSSIRPALDQQFLTDDGEATAFGTAFARVVKQFPRLFRYVTGDAGLTSHDNAQAVVDAGKHYLFALKRNHRWLHNLSIERLREAAVDAESSERYRGKLVIRQLARVAVPSFVRFAGARQFVCVTTTRIDRRGRKQKNTRYFVTSVGAEDLSARRLLLLVRLHWGIENGPNWTADAILREDTHCPCKTGNGLVVMSWLNLLAYNLVAVFRAHLPRTDGRRPSWRTVLRLLYHALLDWQPHGVCPDIA